MIVVKRILSLILVISILSLALVGCNSNDQNDIATSNEAPTVELADIDDLVLEDDKIAQSFSGLDDSGLLQYIKDSVYSDLSLQLNSDNYNIEGISTIYLSQEYIDDVLYNSKENLYFGYTKSELQEQFSGSQYVFSLDENGKTIVKEFEPYDDTYEKILLNVAIGTGVILVCVVVTVATDGADLPVAAIFAASAESGAIAALCSTVISGATAGIVTGIETHDFDESMKAAALSGSEGFKWGAIGGAITGGLSKAFEIVSSSATVVSEVAIPTPRQSEIAALEMYGGEEQISFLNGIEVPYGTIGSSRPDIIREVDGVLEAIEVKNYCLTSEQNVYNLAKELTREISERGANLPPNSLQRVLLDVSGREYTYSFVLKIKSFLQNTLESIYPNIPIDIVGAI
ncbi:MAG: hypothetical protein IJH32_02330 [Ruminococcus sp.]|nr:hypothetical protein [Ruminococcus sp.]